MEIAEHVLPNTLNKRTSLMFHQVIKFDIENFNRLIWQTESIVFVPVLKFGLGFLVFPSANNQFSDQIIKKAIGCFVFTKANQNRVKQSKGYLFFFMFHQKLIDMEYKEVDCLIFVLFAGSDGADCYCYGFRSAQ